MFLSNSILVVEHDGKRLNGPFVAKEALEEFRGLVQPMSLDSWNPEVS